MQVDGDMGQLTTQLAAMFDIDAKTWTMILFVTGLAIYIMRQSASALQLLIFLPAAALLSIMSNHALVLLHVYEPTKLAEWMVWSIAAATVGNLVAIAGVVLVAGFADREVEAAKR